MGTTNEQSQTNHQLACEAFLCRAAMFEHPFVLKGSFATKQYFENAIGRTPNDIDWLYTLPFEYIYDAESIFTDWIDTIINTKVNDGVIFKERKKNHFSWTGDYVGDEDFPTAGIDLECSVKGKTLLGGIHVDISFNIEITAQPVPLKYNPLEGGVFTIPKAVPLSMQVAWKMHQTILRPRFKDIFDLIHFLPLQNTDEEAKSQSIQELVNECEINGGDIKRLNWYVTENAERYAYLFEENQIHTEEFKTLKKELNGIDSVLTIYITDYKHVSTNTNASPQSLSSFLKTFRQALNNTGFTTDTLQNMPQSNIVKQPMIEATETLTTQYQENVVVSSTIIFWDRLRNIFR